jgi:hypothetical protein
MEDSNGFVNGMYKDISGLGHTAPLHERAAMLRAVSKSLICAGIDRLRRRNILIDLRSDFGVELSDRGLEHFLSE